MAGLYRRKSDGRWFIQFNTPPGATVRIGQRKGQPRESARVKIALGRCDKRTAEKIKQKIEAIIVAQLAQGLIDDETAAWIGDIKRDFKTLYVKLAGVGLVDTAADGGSVRQLATTLKAFLDQYIDERKPTWKERTIAGALQDADSLVEFFGPDRRLADITDADAKRFLLWLRTAGRKQRKKKAEKPAPTGDDDKKTGLAMATIGRRIRRSKEFFGFAVSGELIKKNPFAGIKAPPQHNKDRYFFVDRLRIKKLLDACPDAEWRLIVALARYGGVRTPSETLALKWADVDWKGNRVTIHSPKTAHHANKDKRVIPLFPELRPFLEEAFDPESVYVVQRYRGVQVNLRTQLMRILKRAGLTRWPRIWHNLRASRQCELEERHPSHVVCSWIGNSETIARQHYLNVRDSDFDLALQTDSQTSSPPASMDANRRYGRIDDGAGDEQETSENTGKAYVSGTFENGV